MTAPQDSDQQARQALRRQKHVATGLLCGMGVLTTFTYAAPGLGWLTNSFWLETLRAGAKAGVVGGLADWFAVTALFRHPLGIPIPHTAIIPAQKERLGRALGRFVTTQVFTEAETNRMLSRFDLPGWIARLLASPGTIAAATDGLAGMMPHLLERLEDGRAGAAISRALPVVLGGSNLTPVVARGLRGLVEGDCHQEVLSFLLDQLKSGLKAKEDSLRSMIEERVREQGGRILGWAIGGSIATKVLTAANEELERIDPHDSALREGFTAWVRAEIDRMEQDPERGAEISNALGSVFSHETVRVWGADIWARMRGMIEEDIDRPDGWFATLVRETLTRLAHQMETDPALRARITDAAQSGLHRSLPRLRGELSGFIATVVGNWDGDTVAGKLELRVGRDLQFVRINGTMVGFAVGAALFVLLRAVFGATG